MLRLEVRNVNRNPATFVFSVSDHMAKTVLYLKLQASEA